MKKTKQNTYKYGVEIELIVPYSNSDDFIEELEAMDTDKVDIADDGSIRTYDDEQTGHEIRIGACTYSELLTTLKTVTDICAKHEAKVNDSCGLHVHMSNPKFFNPTKLNNIITTWLAIEDFMLATQPMSRLGNSYCKRKLYTWLQQGTIEIPKSKQQIVDQYGRTDRYQTLNLSSLREHGTIECRLHSGTVDYGKIVKWVNLLISFYDYATNRFNKEEVNKLFNTVISMDKVEAIYNMLGTNQEIRTHFNGRISRFDINRLVELQKTAIEVMKIKPMVDKAQKELNKARDKFRSVELKVRIVFDEQQRLLNRIDR